MHSFDIGTAGGRRRAPLAALLGVAALGLAAGPVVAAQHALAEPGHASLRGAASPQGRTWAEIARLPDWQGIWELDWQDNPALMQQSPPSLLPQAQAKLTAYRAAQKQGEDLQPQQANCLPPGMPQIMTQPYPIEFLFNPGKVVVLIEAYEQERTIYTDGRKHPDDPDPTFQGHSIGHWEGDTLVVDTVGFVPFSEIGPGIGHSDQMHIVERIRKVDPNHLQIEQTITDPKVLAKPWTTIHPYVRVNDDLREYICEQNNRDSADPQGRPGERIEP
jgi:hypothetical protein